MNIILYYLMCRKSPLIALFIFSWIFIGNYIIFNLFVSIILDSFSVEETEEETDKYLPLSFKILESKLEVVEKQEKDTLKTFKDLLIHNKYDY